MHALLGIDCTMQNCRAGTQWRNNGKECRSGWPPRGDMAPDETRCVARLFGPGPTGGGDPLGLAASARGARRRVACCQSAANQNIVPDRAIMSCVTQVCVAKDLLRNQTRGLKKPEVQASGIAGAEELQNLRDCSASAVVPVNVPRAGGPRIGCCDHRAASVFSCATQSIRQSA